MDDDMIWVFAIVPFTYVAKNLTLPEGTKIYFDFWVADNKLRNMSAHAFKLVKREVRSGTWLPKDTPISQISFMELTQNVTNWIDVSENDRIVFKVEKKLEGLTKDDPNHPDFRSGV